MEILFKILETIVIIIVLLLAVLGALTIAVKLKRSSDADKVLHSDRRYRWFVYDLLRTCYRSSCIMRNVTIPYNPGVPDDGLVTAEIILVMRGGVAVISTLRAAGYVDNLIHGDWIQYANGHTIRVRNPYELNESNARAVRNLLKDANIPNVRVHNLLVYTDPRTQFKHREDSIVAADNLLAYLRDLNKTPYLSLKTLPNVVNAIRRYRIRRHPAQNPLQNTTQTLPKFPAQRR